MPKGHPVTAWHRTDAHGIPVTFTSRPNEQGNYLLTPQELEGLMRTGGWKPGPIPEPSWLDALAAHSRAAAESKFGPIPPKETP